MTGLDGNRFPRYFVVDSVQWTYYMGAVPAEAGTVDYGVLTQR